MQTTMGGLVLAIVLALAGQCQARSLLNETQSGRKLQQLNWYKGNYGDPVVVGLMKDDKYLGWDGQRKALVWSANAWDVTRSIIKFKLAKPNPAVKNRKAGRIYLNDEFYIQVKKAFYARKKEGSNEYGVTMNQKVATVFRMTNKYSDDRCSPNALEYEYGNLNRYQCSFPFEQCLGYCGYRKFLAKVGDQWKLVGRCSPGAGDRSLFTDCNGRISSYHDYEMELPL